MKIMKKKKNNKRRPTAIVEVDDLNDPFSVQMDQVKDLKLEIAQLHNRITLCEQDHLILRQQFERFMASGGFRQQDYEKPWWVGPVTCGTHPTYLTQSEPTLDPGPSIPIFCNKWTSSVRNTGH